jgi:hypothetical protein
MVPKLARESPDRPGQLEALCGHFNWQTREIEIEKGMNRASQWYTLLHEQVHVALADTGVAQTLDHERTEALCDALAGYLVAARFAPPAR